MDPKPTPKQVVQSQYEQIQDPEQTSTQTLSSPKTIKDVLREMGEK